MYWTILTNKMLKATDPVSGYAMISMLVIAFVIYYIGKQLIKMKMNVRPYISTSVEDMGVSTSISVSPIQYTQSLYIRRPNSPPKKQEDMV